MSTSELWLEKYKPKKYSELLTEEKTNRSIQTWLRSWDEIVFNRPVKKVLSIQPISSGGLITNNNYEKFMQELDYRHHKYILLSGPPGTGKTTLAEIISHICGYDSIVVNASDERNTEDLLNKIENATKVHNLNFASGSSKRPTCLVLDEVDGINFGTDDANNVAQHIMNFIRSGGAVKYSGVSRQKIIVKKSKKIATLNKSNSDAGNESNSDDEDEEEKQKKEVVELEDKESKNSSKEQIMRPIILICNDIYARSIFPFKKDALTFNVKRVDTTRLLDRLKVVNKNEKCGLSDEKLRLIIEKSEYDIRRCLNLMQFLSVSSSNKELLSCIDLAKVSCIGHSDVNQSIFSLWQKLLISVNKSVSGMQFSHLLSEYDSSGDYDTINDGIFINYLNCPKFNDSYIHNEVPNQKVTYNETDTSQYNECQLEDLEKSLSSISEITELMSFANRTFIHFNNSTDLLLAGYYSANLDSPVKRQLRQSNNQSIEYPTFFKNMWRAAVQNQKMISSLCFHYCHFSSVMMSEKVFLSTELPYLNQLIIPVIRDLSVDLLSLKEKQNLFFSVMAILKLGLKITVTEHSIEIIPNILKLLKFDTGANEQGGGVPEIDYDKNFRKMLILSKESARINQLRTIHLNAQDALSHQGHADDFNYYYSTEKIPQNATTIREANMILQSKAETKSHVTNEFVRKKRTSAEQDRDYIFYIKFNEGMTNAIRRNLNFNYFLT